MCRSVMAPSLQYDSEAPLNQLKGKSSYFNILCLLSKISLEDQLVEPQPRLVIVFAADICRPAAEARQHLHTFANSKCV